MTIQILLFFLEFITVSVFSKYNIENIKIYNKNPVTLSKCGDLICSNAKMKNKIFYFKLSDNTKISINNDSKKRYFSGELFVFIKNNKIILNNKLKTDDYITKVVSSELDNLLLNEALKAFYLIVKNYTLSNLNKHSKDYESDFCDLAHCQVYHGNSYKEKIIKETVKDIKDEILCFENNIAKTYFNAICGPFRATTGIIWNYDIKYIKGGKNTFNNENLATTSNNYKWQFNLDKKELNEYLKIEYLKIFESKLNYVTIIGDDKTKWNGENFRRLIAKKYGWGKLKSNQFNLTENKSDYIFSGFGFGNGIGFCIEESDDLAKRKLNYKEIINFFFDNLQIKKNNCK